MKKSLKILLGIAGVLALVGLCFVCLSVYAKKEINKPRFELPAAELRQASPLPAAKEEAFDYVCALYEKTISADDVEVSLHTDVKTVQEDLSAPFAPADRKALSRILEKAQESLGALYPAYENVLAPDAGEIPTLGFTKADVTAFTAEKGCADETGNIADDGNYYITLTVRPGCLDQQAMLQSAAAKRLQAELSSVLTADSPDLQPESFTASFTIRYSDDMLTHAELKRTVRIRTTVSFVGDYRALSREAVQVEIPYETSTSMEFLHYGVRFTERQIAVQKNDMQALPLEVSVNANVKKSDYKLTFDVSENGVLKIDADGVMRVTAAQEAPVNVTATLRYDGHTYTDTLTVYATELEVKTDAPANT